MFPVSIATGAVGPTLFVFKGKQMPYRENLRHGKAHMRIYADLLPRQSSVSFKEERGGVDTANFLNWAGLYLESVRDLTANG